MKYWKISLAVFMGLFSLTVRAAWPSTADELLGRKLVSFKYGQVEGQVSLQEKTFKVYATRTSSLCVRGLIPAQVNKISETEVEVETPPQDERKTCHGRIFKIDTATQTIEMYEYSNNDRTNLRRVSKPHNIQFE